MRYEKIATGQNDRVGIITMNGRDRLNVFSDRMLQEIYDVIENWNGDPGIGAIVLTGSGRAFCAGGDLQVWRQIVEARERGEEFTRWRPEEHWIPFVQRSKPIVCAINGLSIGVGLTLTLCCDVRIASDQARLSARFVRVGVLPELASTRLLVEIIGLNNALELMLTARIIDAKEAGRIGLVNRVVPHENLLDEAVTLASEIAFNPTESLSAVKRLVWTNLTETKLEEVWKREDVEFAAAMERPAFKEAVTAFLEKREPRFHV